MNSFKTACGAAALLLCFGSGAALAQATTGGNGAAGGNGTGTTGGVTNGVTNGVNGATNGVTGAGGAGTTTTTTPNGASPAGTPVDGNTNTANPSASVVQECEAKAMQQGLSGDSKGAFLTDCENVPMKKQ